MTIQAQPCRHNQRRLFSCQRHPAATPVTGLCASCLRERLAGIQSQSPTSTAPITIIPQFRRSKSCSGGPNPPSSSASEPRRKSCDARAHSTLHDLFAVDDRIEDPKPNPNLNLKPNPKPPPSDVQGITSFQDLDEEGEFKTMKEFIDLETGTKKSSRKLIWEAASVFSKKLGKWRRKQEKKKENSARLEQGQPLSSRRLREIQSEIGEYGLGRRSCDTEPRLSADIGRLSVDDPRVYFEPPRASWDGYLIGKQNPRPDDAHAVGEERLSVVEEEKSPGGSAQTKDYYDSVSSHRRRKSFDRAVLNRKTALLGEAEDLKSSISNAKVSPETVGLFHGAKLLVTEKELRDSNWYSLKEYKTQSVESGYKNVEFVASGVSQKGYDSKKLPKWKNLLNILGLIQRRKATDCGCEDKSIGGDVENGSLVESLQKLKMTRRGASGRKDWSVEGNMVNEKLLESLQSVRRSSNAEEDRGSEGKVGEEMLAESLQKIRRASNAEEDRRTEGKVVETTLAESLKMIRRASNAEEDRGIEGKLGEETLAESLQKLKRASNAEEDRGIEGNFGEETLVESLLKLRRASNAEGDRDIGDPKASIGGQKLRKSHSVSGRNPSKVEGASRGTTTTGAETKGECEKRRDNPVLQKNSSVRHPPNPESGLLRFHLAPLKSYRRSKSGKSRLKNTVSAGLNVS